MAHYGERDKPATIVRAGDLDRAVRRVWPPSDAQADAGNYKMAHVIIGGLPVTIEVPRGRTRSGKSVDGQRWSVQLTSHYGAVKRTVGADDEPVDVYIGEDAHQAHLLPVWVIDQIHAETREYDEHKALIGFVDVGTAKAAYLAAFSDNRGHERVGAVVRLSFEEFRQWIKSENTRKPFLYRKSASAISINKHYCSSTCSCRKQESFGAYNYMTDNATGLGKAMNLIKGVMGRMTPAERSELFADAAVAGNVEITKANDMLAHGDDGGSPGRVEDLWDGPADDAAPVQEAHGPDSKIAPGNIGVGPTQSSSGNGAEKMEREYSRHAPQSGVQAATERLGREVAGMRGAMKSIVKAIESVHVQLEAVKAGVAPIPELPNIDKLVSIAVNKAVASALAKAEEDREDEKDHKEDKEAAKAESEAEKEEEADEEGEDDNKESMKSKSAAQLRKMAKSRLTFADRRLSKSIAFAEEGKADQCEHAFALAQVNLQKATGYIDAAKALRDGQIGPVTKSLMKTAIRVQKAIEAAPGENQKIWPSSEAKVEKAAESEAGVSKADLEHAMSLINKAVEGQGTLQASIKDMFNVISGQSKGTGLPPVLPLAKGGDEHAMREAEIGRMASEGVIGADALYQARDAISSMRANMPPNVLSQKIARLPEHVQAVLNRQVA